MFLSKVASLVVAAAVLGATAQDTTATAPPAIPTDISACAIGCITEALPQGNCSSITDLQCLCTSEAFQGAATTCLTTTCTPEDVTAAQAVQAQQCASIVGGNSTDTSSGTETSTSGSSSSTGSSSGTTSQSNTAAPTNTGATTTPPAPTTTGDALGLSASAGFVGAALAFIGALAVL